jgi:tetratricopeptide (TPR) repeat protein
MRTSGSGERNPPDLGSIAPTGWRNVARVQLFLSTVSAEFRSYRDRLRHLLTRPDVEVKVQEDFIVSGDETLEMLDTYIQGCDGVIHLVGDMTGAMAKPQSVAAIAARYPELASRLPLAEFLQPDGPSLYYTQWEAWLALWHGKKLYIATPSDGAPRNKNYRCEPEQQMVQRSHLARLRGVARYPVLEAFTGDDNLAAEVLRSFVLDLLVAAGLTRRPLTLPFASIGPLFKGRSTMMELLENATRPLALIGPGGVGKTRLAIEHAWRQIGRRNAVLLVSAGSVEALNRNLASLCNPTALDLPEQTLTEEAAQRQAALHWLQANPGWLLILDNVDTPEAAAAVETLLPQLSGGQLVLTTRLRNWSAAVQLQEVEVLTPEDATAFLLERTAGRRREAAEDASEARSIAVDDLGGLALALEQAGAYICQRRLSLSAYRSQWQSNRQVVLAWNDPRLMQYDRSLATTWLTSYQQVSEAARTLLRRLAWLSPEPIPESLLEVSVPGDPEAAGDGWEALNQLEGFSLVNRSAEAPIFSVHRLVQEVGRLWQQQPNEPEPNEVEPALRWLNSAFVGNPQDVRSWGVLDPLAPHAKAVAAFADEAEIREPTGRLFRQIGELFYTKATYRDVEPLFKRVLAIDEANYGSMHPNVAEDLNNLAVLLWATNRLAEAVPLICRALQIDEASFGLDHPAVATDLNNLAQLLKATNRLKEAEPLLRRALQIDEGSYGSAHPVVARDLTNLAQLLQTTNRLKEAEPLMRRALQINEASYGLDHPAVATDLTNLAQLLQTTNRLKEAEPLMRRALQINEASYGCNHPDVATTLNCLANFLLESNRLAEAEPLIRRALVITEASFGSDHPKVATGLDNLATLLYATNRLAGAEPILWRTLAIAEASYGLNHPNVACRLNNLAVLLQATNRLAESEPLMWRVVGILEASYGKEHPILASALSNLASLLSDSNHLEEAEPLMRRALAIAEASYGSNHPEVATKLNNLAHILHVTNRLAEAEPLMRRVVDIFETSYGSDHPEVATALNNLAYLLQATNRLAAAEPLMRRALAIVVASYGNEHPKVAISLNNLALLLYASNRLAEAEPLMRRNAEILIAFSQQGFQHPNLETGLSNYRTLLLDLDLSESEIQAKIQSLQPPP